MDTWYTDNLFGIPGDEDGGGMTAFVVFSMMGFFPVITGVPIYSIGSPEFNQLSIKLAGGKSFTLIAKIILLKINISKVLHSTVKF